MLPDYEQTARAWIAKHKPICPACGGILWSVADMAVVRHVLTPLTERSLNPGNSGTGFLIPLVCNGCALVLNVAAAPLGLVPMPDELPP